MGAVTLAHDSAGPRMDIVVPTADGKRTGYLATDESSYCGALQLIFAMSEEEHMDITANARASIGDRFSQEVFEDAFNEFMLIPLRNFVDRGSRPMGVIGAREHAD